MSNESTPAGDANTVLWLLAFLAKFPYQSVPALERCRKSLSGSEMLEGVLGESCWSTGTRRQVLDDLTSSAIGGSGLDGSTRAPRPFVVLAVTKRI
jgi:hypothetical protein